MRCEDVIKKLAAMSDPAVVDLKSKRGSRAQNSYGVKASDLRTIARDIGTNHTLALELFSSGIHEARKLASMIDNPQKVTRAQMEEWAAAFDSWDVCDCCCSSLFVKTQFAYTKAMEWSRRNEEYVKRAAFAMMAHLVFYDKSADDKKFEQFFPAIKGGAIDDRNFVKKAVNWSLRQIGKRNIDLNKKAIKLASEILKIESKSAQWVAAHALRELTAPKVNILGYPR
jgi:3-methyladenine DNA glycosylase AlkD